MAFSIIHRLLKESGRPFTLIEHPQVRTIEDAHEKVPHLTRNLIKTVVFKVKDAQWVLAGVNSADRIDYKKLSQALEVNRKQLRSVPPEAVEEALGFEIGGIGPFPVAADVTVFLDESLLSLGSVFCGSGKNTVTVSMDIADLAAASNALTASIRK